MNYVRGIAIFGGMGLIGCLILWFGVRSFWYRLDKEKTSKLGPVKMKKLERGLAVGIVLFEIALIGIGLAVAASDPHP